MFCNLCTSLIFFRRLNAELEEKTASLINEAEIVLVRDFSYLQRSRSRIAENRMLCIARFYC